MRAVLDACVLYPTILREIVLGCAAAGLLTPLWSPRILGEWTHAAARLGPDQARIAGVEAALLAEAWPDASVEGQGGAEGLDLPDPADRHVIETALAAAAPMIITLNLRDFPRPALAAVGLTARHPDAVLLSLWHADPDPVVASVAQAQARAAAAGGAMTTAMLLKRARLPRLAKALR